MRFDVVIVGGGAIGWSIANRLKAEKASLEVCVVERNSSFAMGSTGRAAGGVRAQFGTPVNIDLSLFSIAEFEKMPKEIAFRQYGYLFVASNERTHDYLESVTRLQQERGVPVNRLTRKEVESIAPYINCDDLISGAFSPTDGYLDPYGVCQFYERNARRAGVVAKYSRELVAHYDGKLILKDPESETVEDLPCEIVVLATGHWSRQVGKLFGVEVPVRPEKHQLAMTDRAPGIPEQIPMVVDLATSFHFRREGEGLLIGYNDLAGNPKDDCDAFDYGFLDRMAEVGLHRLPMLENLGFDTKKCWGGFYAETPDHHAIIDRIENIVICTGFGGHGIMHAPAAGKAVAELILDGTCNTFLLHSLRLSRFAENDLTVEAMVI